MSRRYLWIVFGLLWIGFVAGGLLRMRTNVDDILPWLPEGTKARSQYEWFTKSFGSDDSLIVSWDGCTIDDPRVVELAAVLRRQDGDVIREVITGPELIERVGRESRMEPEAAIDQLQGFLVGPDRETTCLLLYLNDAGLDDPAVAIERVINQAREVAGIPRADLALGGRPFLGYYTSRVTINSMIYLSIPVALLSLLLAGLSLRNVKLLLITLGSSGIAALTTMAMVPWLGFELNGLLTALPSLMFVIGTSGSIHLANYALDLRHHWEDPLEDGTFNPPLSPASLCESIRAHAWKPCLLSSISTALGTMSLLWSDFSAIREFGIFGTIGLGITLVIHLGLVPPLLSVALRERPTFDHVTSFSFLDRVLQFATRHDRIVIAATLVLTGLLVVPLFNLQSRFRISELFTPESEFLRQTKWLEEHLGSVDATEVVVAMPRDQHTNFLLRMSAIQHIEDELAALPDVTATYSAATLLPEPDPRYPVFFRVATRLALERRHKDLLASSFLAEDATNEYWRITLRTSLFSNTTRDLLSNKIREAVATETADWEKSPDVVVTGASQVFEESKDNVMRDFIESLLLAYVLIMLMMCLAMRSIMAGILAMIPNAIPCIAVFGGLGWVDGAVDMGMTVAACIALGIAVDDTSHLLMSLRDALRTEPDRRIAIGKAYRLCAPAMLQTSLICGFAMVPYLWAELIYLSRFGLLLPLLMAAALFGDLVFLPSLVTSRMGQAFTRGIKY